jgi:hypothetical protein
MVIYHNRVFDFVDNHNKFFVVYLPIKGVELNPQSIYVVSLIRVEGEPTHTYTHIGTPKL